MLFVCAWCWRPRGSSGAFGFALFLLLEAIGELGEQMAVSQGMACSLASSPIFEAVDRAWSFELLPGRELAGAGVPFSPQDLESLRVVLRAGVESWVELHPITERLVPNEVGELIWPSIWVVVLGDLGFGVTVLLRGGCPGGDGSSSGRRVLGRVLRLFEWDSLVDSSCLPSGLSGSFLSAVDLAITMTLSLVRLLAKRSW